MLRAVRAGATASEPEVGAAADVLVALRSRGACFRPDLAPLAGRLPAEVDEGLWDLVARGLVTADAFSAVRSLLSARDRWRTRTIRRPSPRAGLARRRAPVGTGIGEGRWSLLPVDEEPVADGLQPGNEELAEVVAWQLLARWGVVAWEVWGRESFRVPWREIVWALRRLEARGVALGGRFVMGLSGEQYALPEAAAALLKVHRSAPTGEQLVVAGADPLNVTGSIVGGARVPTRRNQRVIYRDGAVVDDLQAG
jgi:ATP-dependent Lhr-like helicase